MLDAVEGARLTGCEIALEKLVPQRLKPKPKQSSYRSTEALRHPNPERSRVFPQPLGLVPFPNLRWRGDSLRLIIFILMRLLITF